MARPGAGRSGPRAAAEVRLPAGARAVAAAACAVLWGAWSCCRGPLAYTAPAGSRRVNQPPGPLAIRERTARLTDPVTGLPRAPPKEADVVLDYFQRTFPEVTTDEADLIKRWEEIAGIFGSHAAANELILANPTLLRKFKNTATNAWHQLQRYLGPQLARQVVFAQPYLLTRKGRIMSKSLSCHLNLWGSKERVAEILVKYPGLAQVAGGDFYKGMANMIAVCGSPGEAQKVAKGAVEAIKYNANGGKPRVPEPYPTLVAIFGGYEEAMKAINREPLLLKAYGMQFLGRLARLREFMGIDGAQEVLRGAPFLLLELQHQRKSKKFLQVWETMTRLFGEEEARRRLLERPELFALGVTLQRAVYFAERKLGSVEAVRDSFDDVLRRTGLQEHLDEWEVKPRPRHGAWTGWHMGRRPLRSNSWSPWRNPLGPSGPPRGRWDEEELRADTVLDAEDVEEESDDEDVYEDVYEDTG